MQKEWEPIDAACTTKQSREYRPLLDAWRAPEELLRHIVSGDPEKIDWTQATKVSI